jgi:TonB family protein
VKVEKKHKEAVALKNVKEKKFEKVIAEETNSAKKATYISYYRAVREKIRKHADRNYPRNRNLGQGEILLNFLVTAKGNLLNMQIVDKESTKDALLRNIALDSVEDAGPFPPFPKGMNQYQINFNIIISFEDR